MRRCLPHHFLQLLLRTVDEYVKRAAWVRCDSLTRLRLLQRRDRFGTEAGAADAAGVNLRGFEVASGNVLGGAGEHFVGDSPWEDEGKGKWR